MTTVKSKKQFRYLTDMVINLKKPISKYQLFTQKGLKDVVHAIRITMPKSIKMTRVKDEKNDYYTTKSKKTLNDLEYDIVVKINGVWTVKNELKGIVPHKFKNELRKQHIYPTQTEYGYMTQKKYGEYLNSLSDAENNQTKEQTDKE